MCVWGGGSARAAEAAGEKDRGGKNKSRYKGTMRAGETDGGAGDGRLEEKGNERGKTGQGVRGSGEVRKGRGAGAQREKMRSEHLRRLMKAAMAAWGWGGRRWRDGPSAAQPAGISQSPLGLPILTYTTINKGRETEGRGSALWVAAFKPAECCLLYISTNSLQLRTPE